MKRLAIIIMTVTTLCACQDKKADTPAQQLYDKIEASYNEGNDSACLTGIAELRAKYPEAIEQRKAALVLFQKASLRLSQHDLERTMRSLDAANASYAALKSTVEARHKEGTATAAELTHLTRERMRRDSLQVRYDVLCSQIRYIHKRQKQLTVNN